MRLERTVRAGMRAGGLAVVQACGMMPAAAQPVVLPELRHGLVGIPTHIFTAFAVVSGITLFATILSILYLRERSRWGSRERHLLSELAALRGAQDRAETLLNAERQVIVTWAGRGEPALEGDASFALEGRVAGSGRALLAFATWLAPQDAATLEAATEALRQRGTAFRLTLRGLSGRFVEAQGQAVSGRAMLRLRETTEERRELVELRAILDEARRSLSALATLLDAIPQPIWHRGPEGSLAFVNAAYVAAVEGGTREAVIAEGTELFDRSARDQIARHAGQPGPARPMRLSAVVAGGRRILDVSETATEAGHVGIAVDVSELESVRADLQRQMDANVRTLDQIPTAVAIFDAREQLVFHNAAYQKLWDLDPAFLDSGPRDGEILESLRAARKLPEQADFRSWKADVLAAYRAAEATETWWYLPDGRTLRVVADPNPQGGLTYLFEDVSESMKLASRYDALMKGQAETLDALREPVAVFGADGRLTLANRAFAAIWKVDEKMLTGRPRIDAVIEACRILSPDEGPWADIRQAITGLSETRDGLACRLRVVDGTVLDCTAQPLPEGATLLTFIDVTASVNVERALTEKNDALERAAQLRDTFVHHVSYELRSPLTNIIGFTQLLGDETVGALNERQREYSEHIMRSSAALLVIINDILDLASIDAGSLELQRETVDVQATVEAARRGIEDRLAESQVALDLDVPADIGSFSADGKRVRQILFNLLSNAVGFSEPGQRIRVEARRRASEICLRVTDTGRGIHPEVIERVFERFESHTLGTRHRGVGLGLSIVRSFVELHGGRVEIRSRPGEGTQVSCYFPAEAPDENRAAAE
ncbi:sensor histidine kinase [Methylobacterium organophilum]|uniref:histidine kinase n=2 Tax=Pseudomonadota TaxID=1224 RepID=A0ABQ4TAK4_METOR|nr:PAS domain-containing sensor histidine kinase [Methylobacterium organophilum]UMY18151.1 PAS-domain containing protein [Methylobacterium organophilum]GJE28711.1 Sensor protein DivL [Methylobacterium organophilum]